MRPLVFRLSLALACALLASCADRTSLLIEVSSPLTIPDQIDQLEIVVVGSVSGAMMDGTYDLTSDWPHTVSVRPGQVESQSVTITVTARHGGEFVARHVRRAMFEPGSQVLVRIVIDPMCVGVMCAPDQDCVGGQCMGVVDDGGVPDSGRDGGVDAGCMNDTQCDDGVNCTDDRCMAGNCSHALSDAICAPGFTCDPVLGCPPITCDGEEQCSDGVVCNGTEVCTDAMCGLGTPLTCNDGDDCTTDRCNESMRGCVSSTLDFDSDGYGDVRCPQVGNVEPSDCNDGNAMIFPGAAEECNGADDDCDGTCDEPATCCRGQVENCMTECDTVGQRVCGGACSWGVCSPPPEICNGMDDDCNMEPDDAFGCVQGDSEPCTTDCGSTGTRDCLPDCSRWGDCIAPGETCNGRDDDCDSLADEDFDCVQDNILTCTTTCGSTGTQQCSSTCHIPTMCTAPAEAGCNMRDDDCDMQVDESSECTGSMTRNCLTSCLTMGTQMCNSTTCSYGTCTTAEVCNGFDDDCDFAIDEESTCIPNSMRNCTVCNGGIGTQRCTSLCQWDTCIAPLESCNGIDDDCDTQCDETSQCCRGTVDNACTNLCGGVGTRVCESNCGWGTCMVSEICNGMDDDCDGSTDEGYDCSPAGPPGSCQTTCGTTGTMGCNANCTWNTTVCMPPAEICNGADENCVGGADDGFECTLGEVQSCMSDCDTPGFKRCLAGCTFEDCVPPTESCNGMDDDCDMMTDEDCGGCMGCTGATGVSEPGGRYTVTLGAHAQTGSCGGAGSEGYLTFTLAQASDVFITTHHALTVDTVIYVRQCMCTGAEVTGACNDNADGRSTSVLRLTNLAAGTYNVIVDTKTAMNGVMVPVDIYITPPATTQSDRCGNPTFITAGSTSLTGTTCGFASDYTPVIGSAGCTGAGAGGNLDRVFYFVIPTARTVAFSGCGGSGAVDMTAYLRRVCTDATMSAQVVCNDDGCGSGPQTCGSSRFFSAFSVTNLAAGLYYFYADAYLYSSGVCGCGNYTYSLSGL